MVVNALSRIPNGIMDALIPSVRNAALPAATDDFWYMPIGASSAGQRVTGQTALTFSGCWSATNTIAGLFGALPCKSYRKTDAGREEAVKHESYRILGREPNPEMDSFVFWEMMTQWWINYGNAFAEIQTLSSSDRLFALWPIHPTRVRPEKTPSGTWTGRWEIRNNSGPSNYLDDSDMLNIVGHLSDDGLIGKGVLSYAAKAIGTGLAEEQYQGDFYANGGRPSGILEHPSKLNPEARTQLRREWKEIHGKANEVAVLWEGMKFNPISVAPEHAEIIESRVFSIQEMSRFYDLPPHVLYELSKGTFANTEEMNRFLVSQSLYRRLVRVEKACDRQLFTESEKKAGYYVKFNVSALLQGDPKQQAEVLAIELQNGVTSQDEWRALKDRNKLPDGQGKNHWIRRDMATLDLVLKSGGEVPGGESAPGAPKPETPPTPPTPDQQANVIIMQLASRLRETRVLNRSLIRAVRELKSGLFSNNTELAKAHDERNEAKSALSVAISEHAASMASANVKIAELQAESRQAIDALVTKSKSHDEISKLLLDAGDAMANRSKEIDALKLSVSALESQKIELSALLESSKTEAEAITEAKNSAESQCNDLQARLGTLETELSAANEQLTNAISEREQNRSRVYELTEKSSSLEIQLEASQKMLEAADNELMSAKNAAQLIAKDKLDAESAVSALRGQLTDSESLLAKANSRGDKLKTRVDELSSEVGTLRAESDAFRVQTTSLTTSRDDLIQQLADAKESLKEAKNRADIAEKQAENSEKAASERLDNAKLTVLASIRSILDESLKMLLSDEQQWVKEASRKPEQFKEITAGHYHHFLSRLNAQLSGAASAMEAVGCDRVDVAKIASEYVSESRTKLHNVFHKTARADLRPEIRKELESWEGRRQTLLNWIGE